jgi:hypothetical protein
MLQGENLKCVVGGAPARTRKCGDLRVARGNVDRAGKGGGAALTRYDIGAFELPQGEGGTDDGTGTRVKPEKVSRPLTMATTTSGATDSGHSQPHSTSLCRINNVRIDFL